MFVGVMNPGLSKKDLDKIVEDAKAALAAEDAAPKANGHSAPQEIKQAQNILDQAPASEDFGDLFAPGTIPLAVDIAQAMIDKGSHVILFPRGQKATTEKGWQEAATRDMNVVRQKAASMPYANVGVVGKPDGNWFFDDDQGTLAEYENQHGRIVTYRVRSVSGGTHLHFKQNDLSRAMGNINGKDESGAETWSARVNNRYVVAPGSSAHPNNDMSLPEKLYTKVDDVPVIEAPASFIEFLKVKTQSTKKAAATAPPADVKIAHGGIHNFMLTEAGKLRNMGLEEEEIYPALSALVHRRCEPPIDESKVRAMAKSICNFPVGGANVPLKMSEPKATTGPEALVTKMSKFGKKKIYWLWQNRVPYGFLCTLAGDPDEGKSLITLYIAARVSRGEKLYDNIEDTAAAEVLILSAEDDPESTLRPRLEAAGADLDKIHLFESVQTRDGAGNTAAERLAQLDTDIAMVDKVLDDNPNIKLVIIDPISSFLGAASINREQEVRRVLQPLAKRARVSGLAVVMVAHFNKNSETRSAMDRVGGAKAIVGMGRSAWTCVREPEKEQQEGESMPIADPDRRLFLKLKGNLAPSKIGGLVYTIKTTLVEVEGKNGPELVEQPYIAWLEQTQRTAHEVVIGDKNGPKKGSKTEEAKNWLREFLEADDGHASTDAIDEIAEGKGYGTTRDGTLRRAKAMLRVTQGWVGRESHWGLPGKMPKVTAPMADVNKSRLLRRRNSVDLAVQGAK